MISHLHCTRSSLGNLEEATAYVWRVKVLTAAMQKKMQRSYAPGIMPLGLLVGWQDAALLCEDARRLEDVGPWNSREADHWLYRSKQHAVEAQDSFLGGFADASEDS